MDLSVMLGSHRLESPLIAASGTVGSIIDFTATIDFSLYGAAVAKSVSPEPWSGRPAPRIAPVGSGMLNGIGIQNPGIDEWIDHTSKHFPEVPTQVWGSAVAHDVHGFAIVAERMADAGIGVIEINLSCPNLEGVPFALDASSAGEVVRAVRSVVDVPIGAKLSSDAASIEDVAEQVALQGADWVVVANTVTGAAIDPHTRRPLLSGLTGGYSGEAIRPIAMRSVLRVATALPDLPIVACGGVSHGDHVIEYALAGATAVAIGSAHFASPRIASKITKQLKAYAAKNSISRFDELKGAYEPW
jgi:dihydroorotate dehydrogenase (NAD+) catalytic subunit